MVPRGCGRACRSSAEINVKQTENAPPKSKNLRIHPFEPVYDRFSEILILGTFPSVKSRENHFYYGHPQNRFWKVLAAVFREEEDGALSEDSLLSVPQTVEEKKEFLRKHHIALWDVIASCEIEDSDDASIRRVLPNDLGIIFSACDIKVVCTNGKTAEKLYRRHLQPTCGREPLALPSTSPANAAASLERLTQEWSRIKRPVCHQ